MPSDRPVLDKKSLEELRIALTSALTDELVEALSASSFSAVFPDHPSISEWEARQIAGAATARALSQSSLTSKRR